MTSQCGKLAHRECMTMVVAIIAKVHREQQQLVSGLGIAVFGGMALAFGLNSASKARARGAENQANANAKSIEVLANLMSRDTARQDAINIDVQQTQRAMASALGTGGSASSNALATAEALTLLNNQSNGINSAVGGCNYLRVARVSGSRLCGCDTCEG